MTRNVQTTTQLHSSHTLAKWCSKFSKQGFNSKLTENFQMDLPHSSVGKESACNAEDLRLIPGLGRFAREGNINPLQYSCLENSIDRGAWQATVHGVAKNWKWLSSSAHTPLFFPLLPLASWCSLHWNLSVKLMIYWRVTSLPQFMDSSLWDHKAVWPIPIMTMM